jgi:hypothetical protein
VYGTAYEPAHRAIHEEVQLAGVTWSARVLIMVMKGGTYECEETIDVFTEEPSGKVRKGYWQVTHGRMAELEKSLQSEMGYQRHESRSPAMAMSPGAQSLLLSGSVILKCVAICTMFAMRA